MTETSNPEDFSAFGKVRVTGKDRITVLHNILTNDIKNIPSGNSAPAALLSAQGKIKMFMEVFVLENWVFLLTEPGLAGKTISLIDPFIISEEVVLEDISKTYQLPASIIPKFLFPENEAGGILSIETGIPRYGMDMNENTTLSETGLEKTAVSWTKGCYPGQEVVARIDAYGGLHRKIRGLIFDQGQLPKPGSKIYADGKEIGWVTRAAVSKKLGKGIALGFLAKGYFEKDLPVKISWGEISIEAQTAGFPLTRDGDDIRGQST